jgi:competence protein ComEC
MAAIVQLSDWFVVLPKAFLYVRAPTLPDFIIYYVFLLGAFSGLVFLPKVRRWAAIAAAVVGFFYIWEWQASRAVAQISVLPLDGGMSIFATAPRSGGDLLMDTGPAEQVRFELQPFLAGQAVNSLERLLLTHGDLRHIGGAEDVAKLFSPRGVYISTVSQRSPKYREIVQHFGEKPNLLRKIGRGERLGSWRVLHPETGEKSSRADDAALVLLGEFHGVRILLLPDLGRLGQEVLLAREPDLRADVIVAGLPSIGEPVCDALLETAKPRAIVVADSDYPAYERASPKLLERLCRNNVAVLSTRATGVVTIQVTKKGCEIRGMDGTTLKLRLPKAR